MVTFLSPEWIDALDGALRAAGAPPSSGGSDGIVIQHVVASDDETEPDAAYAIVVTLAEGSVSAGRHDNPTVTYTQRRSCASAIASGDRSPHDAFMLGELTVNGDTQALIAASDLLGWLDAALASVRSDTTYDVH